MRFLLIKRQQQRQLQHLQHTKQHPYFIKFYFNFVFFVAIPAAPKKLAYIKKEDDGGPSANFAVRSVSNTYTAVWESALTSETDQPIPTQYRVVQVRGYYLLYSLFVGVQRIFFASQSSDVTRIPCWFPGHYIAPASADLLHSLEAGAALGAGCLGKFGLAPTPENIISAA